MRANNAFNDVAGNVCRALHDGGLGGGFSGRSGGINGRVGTGSGRATLDCVEREGRGGGSLPLFSSQRVQPGAPPTAGHPLCGCFRWLNLTFCSCVTRAPPHTRRINTEPPLGIAFCRHLSILRCQLKLELRRDPAPRLARMVSFSGRERCRSHE
jgi:hypothetical protein